jgi:hypothetical protein
MCRPKADHRSPNNPQQPPTANDSGSTAPPLSAAVVTPEATTAAPQSAAGRRCRGLKIHDSGRPPRRHRILSAAVMRQRPATRILTHLHPPRPFETFGAGRHQLFNAMTATGRFVANVICMKLVHHRIFQNFAS